MGGNQKRKSTSRLCNFLPLFYLLFEASLLVPVCAPSPQ
uniref:Uncharacterized protein n=1 Tax=Rhizophora mucronata TaxID=61149 RepID=A0A2P2QMP8_RHIMU